MSVKPDRWIRRMALEHKMIERSPTGSSGKE